MGPARSLVGVVAGAALGLGVVAVVDAGTPTAGAQAGFTVTPAQLQINQKISSAAVKRSNRALNYLAPVRTAQTDSADDGSDGVTPLAQVPGAGQGWTSGQIADSAITTTKLANAAVTTAKIADAAVTTAKIANGAVGGAQLSAQVQAQLNTIHTAAVNVPVGGQPSLQLADGATAVARVNVLPVGAFDVTFGTSDVSQCVFTASTGTPGQPGAVTPVFGPFTVYATLLNQNTLRVFTFNSAAALADAPFAVQVVC